MVLYAAAWALPVMKCGTTLPNGLPGAEALTVALSPIWEHHTTHPPLESVGVLSGLSNLAFLGGLGLLWSRERVAQLVQWTLVGAAALNSYWYVCEVFSRDEYRVGYFTWVGSFVVLALAAGLRALSESPSHAPRDPGLVAAPGHRGAQ